MPQSPVCGRQQAAAVAAAEVFVLLSDMPLTASDRELKALTLNVAAGEMSEENVVRFFREHAVRRSEGHS